MSSLRETVSLSKRPHDTRFKQQKLPAWQPIITAGTVLPLLFTIGVVFIPLGAIFLVTSNNISELVIDYTGDECRDVTGERCVDLLRNNTGGSCNCTISFNITHPFKGNVYLYYGLSNFYQNHRRYVKSRDDLQLIGERNDYDSLSSDCDPYRGHQDAVTMKWKAYAPCGAIANSLFNDTFDLKYDNRGTWQKVVLLKTGIAWSTDRSTKFHNPPGFSQNPAQAYNNTLAPPYWQHPVYELDPSDPSNNGYENEDLMVWMRTAALPTFKKLHRRIEHKGVFEDGLPAGAYSIEIKYVYPTWSFDGSKMVSLTTTSFIGGKNCFLGIAYLLIGFLCLILGLVFLVIHFKFNRSKSSLHFEHLTPY